MLHGYGLIFLLMSPISVVFLGTIFGLCAVSHCIAKGCAKVPQDALIVNRSKFCFKNALISTGIAVGSMIAMMLVFINIPWFEPVFSEWGILYEKAIPQTVIYYVLWGTAYYFALFIQKQSILKQFQKEFFGKGVDYFNFYTVFCALTVFLFQTIIGVITVYLEIIL